MLKFICIFFLASFLFLSLPSYTIKYTRPYTIDDYIIVYANEYKVSPKTIRRVLKAESQLNCNPKGHNDGGLARGIAQFHEQTFDTFSKELGEKLDYNSCSDQIKLMAFAFSKGERYRRHWTTY